MKAHSLVCFLAYVLWKTLEQWQQRAGLGHSPRTILEKVRRIQSTDIVLLTEDGRELRLRCVVRSDAAQAALLGSAWTCPSDCGCHPSLKQPKCSGDFFSKPAECLT